MAYSAHNKKRLFGTLIWLLVVSVAVLPVVSEAGIKICRGDDGALTLSVAGSKDDPTAPCPRRTSEAVPPSGAMQEASTLQAGDDLPAWSTCYLIPCAPAGSADRALLPTPDIREHPVQAPVLAVLPLPIALPAQPGAHLAYTGSPPPTSSLSPLLRSVVLLI